MIVYECDRCGRRMGSNDSQRYIVKLEVYAAADHIDLDARLISDPRREMAEVLSDLAGADPDEVEDRTYRSFSFDLCDACRGKLIAKPLG